MAESADSPVPTPPASPASPGVLPGLARLNEAEPDDALKLLGEVCASRSWIDTVAGRRPYRDTDELFAASDLAMSGLTSADLDEAMAGHAVIGKPRAGDATSQREQSGVRDAGNALLADLADANQQYFDRFGHVFLICATGRTAAEMLDALRERLGNDAGTERDIAREELRKINRIRLEKLVQA
ncbi:2-oxo-4-hydroxy-4-carboxy-5-ureidoimidazoline decarboxylase [Yinghuangia soli]|uniref:2-oxo-4-hydroxy-4-carboxy-5-ureidoimidazoline decarboxylase n=1 Tax=Yinghuangia soli TaxID=2908204 RepID=A0AA41U6T7_9ACTN|nr:2-oxo-4-hydroxy-4-carboxy-5-ureidoimidazoline decarboxylase [Yinghuangia soli]MCF2533357.1 2-oxo-4-hydroxy-4-carboxy-5-ureidoimidazoline decarboxylase [Yinghuangia soli]